MKKFANTTPPRSKPATFAPATVLHPEDAERHQRVLRPRLDDEERDQQRRRDREPRDRPGRAPAVRRRVRDGVDEQREPGGDRDRAARCPGSSSRSERLSRTKRGARSSASAPTGTLTKKIHSQPRYFVSSAAGEHADGGARAADRAPDAERLVALGPFLEHRRDDRERSRRDDRRAEPLHGARADQHALGPREAAEERGDREDGDADVEDAACGRAGRPHGHRAAGSRRR